jgi:plasmid stabilization system protein ParE
MVQYRPNDINMKEWKVVYREEALQDIGKFVLYCERSEASERFVKLMQDQIGSLKHHPYRYCVIFNRSIYRRMLYRPFQILYQIDESAKIVRIMRVWHSARDLSKLF